MISCTYHSNCFTKKIFNFIKTWHLKALNIKISWLQFNILQQLLLVICVRYRLTVLICDNMKYYLLLYKKGGSQNTGHRKWESLLHVLPRNFFGISFFRQFFSCNITHLLYFYSIHLTSYPPTVRKKCNVSKLTSIANIFSALFLRRAYISILD